MYFPTFVSYTLGDGNMATRGSLVWDTLGSCTGLVSFGMCIGCRVSAGFFVPSFAASSLLSLFPVTVILKILDNIFNVSKVLLTILLIGYWK